MYNEARVRAIAAGIAAVYPNFDGKGFIKKIAPLLKPLEMKDRVRLISRTLKEFLPAKNKEAFAVLLRSIETEKNPAGLSGFQAWPFTQFVEDYGLEDPELSLQTLKELTKVMSAEFAIRPFLLKHTELTLKLLRTWVHDKNVHVRRLVSEGTRPRLPWGQRLTHFQKDPTIGLEFLNILKHDPELYVRKSVANHLNDFSKDHGDWLVKELGRWKKAHPDDKNIQWILRHGSRTLVKAGHPGVLALHGFSPAAVKAARLSLGAAKIKMGQSLAIAFSAQATRNEKWLIDYAIHHRKANGELKPKVFKWTQKMVKAGETLRLEKKHRFVPISTRKYYGGLHRVEVFVNGKSVAKADFQLEVKPPLLAREK